MADKQTVKVGDKVKSLVTQLDVREGATYEVKNIDFDGDIWVTDDVGDRFYLTTDEFELLPVADATGKPDFKVGDRVRLTAGEDEYRHSGSIGLIEKLEKSYARVLFDAPFDGWGETGRNWHVQLSNLEPAPLTIETGKFYRTRDGRKVGPIGSNNTLMSVLFPFVDKSNESDCWSTDGKFLYPGHPDSDKDLIAEWLDEPTSNDNAAPSKPAIVALIKDGQPKPSEQPRVHPSQYAAIKEAKRLASRHKGQDFGVFVLSEAVSEPIPLYEHEWQNLAANGQKVAAIKELRRVTGLGLAATKRAIEHWAEHDEQYSRRAA
ncbi:hypothetical protein [Brucella sp. 22210]|uniref:hypothetical protein n=1 Tax=Brucella sp. 22210 TaxID=3453892 RepID=UPI003F87232F